jgi:uncharacterized protein YjbI with pentapeptide repeats
VEVAELNELSGDSAEHSAPQIAAIHQGELEEILETHKRWIESNGGEGKMADLSRAQLASAYLQGADLRGANMQMANLYKADLSSAKLQESNLYKASFKAANLQGGSLISAELRSANLESAQLEKFDLRGADLNDLKSYKGWIPRPVTTVKA